MITWIGNYSGTGAYPTICRQMTQALARQGVTVLHNVHNHGTELTDVAVSCTYPPLLPNVRHKRNVVYLTWEFLGGRGVPRSFIEVFDQADLIISMSEWVAEQFRAVTRTPVAVVPLGYDPSEFNLAVPKADLAALFPGEAWAQDTHDKVLMLWVGGTDKRHGLDIAVEVTQRLPKAYHLIVKTSVDYPAVKFQHDRVHILRQDFPSLAPLYHAADMFLHTARAVGFSMPVLEALVCNTPVVSTPVPPVMEFGESVVFSEGGQWEYFKHHLHRDCTPQWYEPDIDSLVEQVLKTVTRFPFNASSSPYWRNQWTWDSAAQKMKAVLCLS